MKAWSWGQVPSNSLGLGIFSRDCCWAGRWRANRLSVAIVASRAARCVRRSVIVARAAVSPSRAAANSSRTLVRVTV